MDKNKIQKRMFALDEASLALSKNVNSQNNRFWCYKNTCAVYKIPLSDHKVRVCCTVSAHKIIVSAFFEEINSNHNIKLILTTIIQGINKRRESIGHSTFFARTEGQFLKRNY